MTPQIVLNHTQKTTSFKESNKKIDDLNSESQWNGRKVALVVILGVSSALAATAGVIAGLFAMYITAIACAAASIVLALSALLASRIKISQQVIGFQKVPQPTLKLDKKGENQSSTIQKQNPLNTETDSMEPSTYELYAQTLRDKEHIESLDQKIIQQQKIIDEIQSKIPTETSLEEDTSESVNEEITQQQIEELTEVLNELVLERDQAREKVRILERDLALNQERQKTISEEILRHKEENNKKQEEIELLKKKAEEVPQNRNKEQQEEYERAQKQIQELQSSTAQRLERIDQLQKDLEAMQEQQQEINLLNDALEKNKTEKDLVEQKYQETLKQKEEAENSKHKNEQVISQLNEKIREHEQKLKDVEQIGKRLTRRSLVLQTSPSSENLILESKKTLNDSFDTEEISESQAPRKKKSKDAEELENLRKELAETKGTLQTKEEELKIKTGRVKEQAREISTLKANIEQLEKRIEDFDVEAKNTRIKQQEEAIKKLRDEKKRIEDKFNSFIQNLEAFKDDLPSKFSFIDSNKSPEKKVSKVGDVLSALTNTLDTILLNN